MFPHWSLANLIFEIIHPFQHLAFEWLRKNDLTLVIEDMLTNKSFMKFELFLQGIDLRWTIFNLPSKSPEFLIYLIRVHLNSSICFTLFYSIFTLNCLPKVLSVNVTILFFILRFCSRCLIQRQSSNIANSCPPLSTYNWNHSERISNSSRFSI